MRQGGQGRAHRSGKQPSIRRHRDIGVAVAEQPDLLLVEDGLAMVPDAQVVRDVRECCPDTLVAAQVAPGDRVGSFLEAGAAAFLTRRVPPQDATPQRARAAPGGLSGLTGWPPR